QSQCCMVHSAGRFTTGQITGEKGSFFSLTNLEKEEREFLCCLSGENDSFSVRLPAGYTALLPVCLELGEGYKLTGSSYELAYVQFPNPEGQCEAEASNGQFFAEHKSETGDRSCRRAQIALYGFGELTVKLEYKGRIYGLHKSEACEAEQPQRILLQDLEIIYGTPEQIARLDLPGIDPWRLEDANACASASVKRAGVSIPPEPKKMPEQNRLQEMERYGQYRGLGSYEFELEAGQESLLFGLSDIITVYHDGQFQSSFYGDGSARRMSLSKGTWRFDTEIWGHCNFEDIRVPALKMGSLKGIRKILHIVRSEDISCNWELENTGSWMDIDSYNTPASPVTGRYTKEIQLWGDCTDYALTFGCADCAIQVWVNGKKAGDVQSGDRTMDITPFVLSGELCRISLLVTRRYYSDQVGSITLTGGNAQTDCRYQDRTFLGYTGGMEGSLSFPVRLNAGEKLILQPEIPAMGHGDLKLIFHGREMLLTVACGGHIAGRIALNASMLPKVAGGAPNEIFLCGEWLARDGVTVVSPNREAVLEWGMRPAAERKRGGVSILCQALSESAVLEQIEIRYKMNA
ncbi:MAG: hypothetical protein LUI07_01055, partial [Lachnospiraceae bacterium]|nr:hypothetical protein [Lachnospiraceae bacterium]